MTPQDEEAFSVGVTDGLMTLIWFARLVLVLMLSAGLGIALAYALAAFLEITT